PTQIVKDKDYVVEIEQVVNDSGESINTKNVIERSVSFKVDSETVTYKLIGTYTGSKQNKTLIYDPLTKSVHDGYETVYGLLDYEGALISGETVTTIENGTKLITWEVL